MYKPEHWPAVVASMPQAIVVFFGSDLTIVGCSDIQLELWGKSAGQVVNRKAHELLSEERVSALRKVFETGRPEVRKGVALKFEKDGIMHSGIYDYTYKPWRADDENRGVIALISDVTETHRERQQIKTLTENILSLANAMPQLVWIADQNGVVTYYNDRLSQFHGAVRQTDSTWLWAGLLHGYDLGHTQVAWNDALRTGTQYQAEHRIMMADRSFRWHLSRALPQKTAQGEITMWYGTATDIHDLKHAEEEIRRKEKKIRLSESNFRKLAHSLPQIVWTTDEWGKPNFFNHTWYAYTGMAADADTSAWTGFFHPDEDFPDLASFTQGPINDYNKDVRLRDAKGQYSWFSMQINPMYDDNGAFVKLIVTLSNIDQRKEAEQQLQLLVDQRTQALQRSNQDLSQFAHITSHDLKEPLRKITSFSLRLEDELGSGLPQKAALYISKIQHSASRLSAMVDGILDYSQADASEITIEHIDVKELVTGILNDLELVISEKKATVNYENVLPMTGAPVLVRQLFYNLINNSLKFSKPDQAPEITITSAAIGEDYIEYKISDNGIGIQPQYAERIFETFFRLNSKDRYEGTGLGLALCRKIAARHGGTIRASGEGSQGSTFVVTWPVKIIKPEHT